MGLSCGVSTLKYVLFVFNVLCSLISLAIIAVASVALVNLDQLSSNGGVSNIMPIILLVVGIISFLIAFFGCCGAIRDSTCLLNTYAVLLMVLLVGKIAIGAYLLSNTEAVTQALTPVLRFLWDHRETEMAFWDRAQTSNECCGLNAPSDWSVGILGPLPASCCSPGLAAVCTPVLAHQRGCLAVLEEMNSSSVRLLAYVALAAAGIELIGFIFSCILINGVRNEQRRQHY